MVDLVDWLTGKDGYHMRSDYTNSEGYVDPTATAAILGPKKYPTEEEHKDESLRSGRIITAFVQLLKDTDFEFAYHVKLKSKKTGAIYG